MLSIDHAFCERLYSCDFNRSREVVQTFNRTSLSERAAYRVWDFGNPVKIQGRAQKYHVPAPIVTRKKIIELCYLNTCSGMGSINISTEDLFTP